uniref:Portal protein n=1 Tax=viral metagenome TaxID=1070528 RepID=A0A6M3II29_9ZZZZ
MVKHPLDEKDVKRRYVVRLQTLAKAWADKWGGAYEHSQKLQQLWISGYYNKGYSRWHLINMMNRAVSSGVAFLAEGNPRVLIEPKAVGLQTFAYAMRLITNFLIEKNDFAGNVFIPGAVASYFGAAIARTFYAYDRVISLDNEVIKVGTPTVKIIEPCDYVGDPSAKTRSDFAFEGDIYRLPTEYAKDLFVKYADFIEEDAKLAVKYSTGELLKEGYDPNTLALEEFTTFIDVFNRKEKVIETILPMGHKAVVLKTIEHKGSDSPYDYLGYRYPTNVPLPIPPAWDVYDIDVTTNIIAQSERQRAESQKTVLAGEPASKRAMDTILKKAKHMDYVTAKGADGIKEYNFGGPTAEGLAWIQFAESQFQKAGTTTSDIMSGKGPTSETLGQDQLVYANASRMVNSYYTRFHSWMTSILRKWVYAVMQDPTTYVEVLDTVKVPGLNDYQYPVFFSKADKVADFSQLVLDVIPYSTQRMSPEMRYQRLMQFMTTWIMPTMQLRREQGSDIDLAQVDRLLADYGGFDQFPSWYRSVTPTDQPRVDYVMKTGNPGQQNDSLGASFPSRLANSEGYNARQGIGAERTPSNMTEQVQ